MLGVSYILLYNILRQLFPGVWFHFALRKTKEDCRIADFIKTFLSAGETDLKLNISITIKDQIAIGL